MSTKSLLKDIDVGGSSPSSSANTYLRKGMM